MSHRGDAGVDDMNGGNHVITTGIRKRFRDWASSKVGTSCMRHRYILLLYESDVDNHHQDVDI